MSSTDLVVFGMCAVMVLIGIVVFRVSPRDRAMAVITVIIGVVGFVAYLTAEEDVSPPAMTTPTVLTDASPTPDASPAP